MYTLRLGGNGIYVGVKESGGSVPKSASDIRAFRNVVILLYKFKVYIQIYICMDMKVYECMGYFRRKIGIISFLS